VAEGFRRSGADGFGVDLDHSFSVGRDDLGDHAPLSRIGGRWDAVRADGKRAASAKGIKGNTFRAGGEAGVRVIEERDGGSNSGVTDFIGVKSGCMAGATGF
jgi:hypothetical protein